MKRFLVFAVAVLLSCLIVAPVLAAPFLVSDYYPASDAANLPDGFTITYGSTTITGAATIQSNVAGDKRVYWDLGPLSPGTYNLSVKATKADAIWGALESTSVPFVFTKPASTLKSPVNINISR
jgi:hypothetical protein